MAEAVRRRRFIATWDVVIELWSTPSVRGRRPGGVPAS